MVLILFDVSVLVLAFIRLLVYKIPHLPNVIMNYNHSIQLGVPTAGGIHTDSYI